MADAKSSIERRFWRLVTEQPNGCWEWRSNKNKDGYGLFASIQAHRVAYEFANGPLPPFVEDPETKNCILHTCHNRACVNPAHLTLGTKRENTAMASAAGRLRGGHGRKGGGNTTGKPVVVHGVQYESLMAASRQTGLSRQQLRYAIATHKPWASGNHK